MRMAFLGTGIMGGPIARNLAGAGHEVTVWNRSREKAEGLGARVAESPAEAVDGAEVLVTMLADGPAIEAVVPELDPETLWIQMSTIGVADTARFSARHPRYVDAPVLGSKPQAETGELLVLAAGAERPEEVFDAIATRVMWLADEPGAGTKLKLATNLWRLLPCLFPERGHEGRAARARDGARGRDRARPRAGDARAVRTRDRSRPRRRGRRSGVVRQPPDLRRLTRARKRVLMLQSI
jgi:NAD binding domain of 6-phosphogluconate dehydrogenase